MAITPTQQPSQQETIALIEARRKDQESYAWQSLGYYFVTQGVLLGFLANVEDDHSWKTAAVGVLGVLSTLVLLQTYLRARLYEEQYSLLLKPHGLDHRTLEALLPMPEKPWFWDRGRRRWFVRELKARYLWPPMFLLGAIAWTLYLAWLATTGDSGSSPPTVVTTTPLPTATAP